MQTFLPYPDFERTAEVLDDRRLGKQRVEVLQILRALHFEGYGWRNHPAVAMWRGAIAALVTYGDVVTREWLRRGYADTVLDQIAEFVTPGRPRAQQELATAGLLPAWLGWDPLHCSHQAALVRKDPAYYRPWFPDADADQDYVWPPLPPEDPPDTRPISGWVVRPASAAAAGRFLDERIVGMPLPATTRAVKRHRELRAFVDDLQVGSRVVVPFPSALLLGTVLSEVEPADPASADVAITRRVSWDADVERRALRWPAALQNPSLVYPLRGEDGVLAPVAPPLPGARGCGR